jgi:hypothetical protein
MRDTTDDARVGADAFRELRLATRAIYRSPGFFAIAVTILALGLGMSTAMFSLFRTVLV